MFKRLSFVAFLAVMAALLVGPAEAQTAAEVDGVWRGERSGNEVRQTLRPGGDLAISAVTSNIQSDFQIFPRTGPYEWRSDTPGASALLRLQGGVFIVSMPSGFNDTFHRISAPPAATVAAPPPQRVLTAAEQERVRAAQSQLDSSQSSLDFCREMEIGAFCAELETQAAEDRQRLSQITAQPSRPLPPLADAQRRDRVWNELMNLSRCRLHAPIAFSYLGPIRPPRSREEREQAAREREQAARDQQERERHLAACQPDMNAINGTLPATQVSEIPVVSTTTGPTPEWLNNLEQSGAAAERRERELAQRARRIHNGLNDATDCMRVEATRVRAEWGMEGNMRMINTCSYPVQVRWCGNRQDCETTPGDLWTIGAGREWPIFYTNPMGPDDVRVGACRVGAQAVAATGGPGLASNERHLEPQSGPPGVRGWERNICD